MVTGGITARGVTTAGGISSFAGDFVPSLPLSICSHGWRGPHAYGWRDGTTEEVWILARRLFPSFPAHFTPIAGGVATAGGARCFVSGLVPLFPSHSTPTAGGSTALQDDLFLPSLLTPLPWLEDSSRLEGLAALRLEGVATLPVDLLLPSPLAALPQLEGLVALPED